MSRQVGARRRTVLVAASMAVVMGLQGCASNSGQAGAIDGGAPVGAGSGRSAPAAGSSEGSLWKAAGCVIGGIAGAAAGKLAAGDPKKSRLSKTEQAKRERSYLIAGALLGCGGGAVLSGTVYEKLSEAGRREREKALIAAASQARPQRYGEPGNPTLKGGVVPGKRYAEVAEKRECMDVEDTLADGSSKDSIFVKMCRNLPNGGWAPVTA